MADWRRKVLVTGGAGFIGSHLVDRLLAEGDHVTVVDNFDPFYDPEAKWANIGSHLGHPGYRLVQADIRAADALRKDLAGDFDVIVHLAAKAGVRPSIADPIGYYEVNVQGTQALLELAKEWGVKQFVFASSSSVYGVNPRVPWREDDHDLQPISPYASTKLSGEMLGHVYSHLYGIRFVALRFFTVYGPRQRPDLAIHKFARLIRAGKPIPVYGDGSAARDYSYIDDIVEGVARSITFSAAPFARINLGSDKPVLLRDMIAALEDALGRKAEIQRLPEQPGDVPQTWADLSNSDALLGKLRRTAFEDGLKKFVDWFAANGSGAR